MRTEDYRTAMSRLYLQLGGLPEHSDSQVEITAGQLAGMNADLGLGRLEIDPAHLRKGDVQRELREIENMNFDELDKTINLEKPFDGSTSRDEWCRYAKVTRGNLLLKQFSLLSRLRSDEPEAWDEVNELFYDD